MCISCEDVRADTKVECDSLQNVDGKGYQSTCRHTFSGGFSTETVDSPQGAYSNDVFMNTSFWSSTTNRNVFAKISGIVFRGMADLPENVDLSTEWTALLRPEASQCTLSWCAQTYAASNCSRNEISDKPTSPRTLLPLLSSCYLMAGNSQRCVWFPSDEPPPSAEAVNASKLAGSESNIYWLNQQDIRMLYNDFQGAFDFSIQMVNGWYRLTPIGRITYSGKISTPVVLADVATSLSNHMREAANLTVIKGTVVAPVTHVKVNWGWPAYLGLLVALALICLAWSIAFSFTHGGEVWKSSSLPLLFTGLSGWEDQHGAHAEVLKEMKRRAKCMNARVAYDVDGGVTLVRRIDVVSCCTIQDFVCSSTVETAIPRAEVLIR